MKIIRINNDGSMNELSLKLPIKCYNILDKNSKSKGKNKIKELYLWKYENDIIKCYGWYAGNNGFENKHDLPPNGSSHFLEIDSSKQMLYGDLFIVKYDNETKYKDISVTDYSLFYECMIECDDYSDYSCEENNETEEDEYEETYISSDNESECDSIIDEIYDGLLDNDDNIY